MARNKDEKLGQAILDAVGGPDNVALAMSCLTRLRLHIKDEGLVNDGAVRALRGVLGTQWSGGLYQIIIGQNVGKVCRYVVNAGAAPADFLNVDLDFEGHRDPRGVVDVGQAILGYLSGSVVPLMPMLMVAGLFKAMGTLIGPGMLGLVEADADIVVVCNILFEAALYFMPLYLGSNAARQLGATPILGAYLGGILIAPTFIELVHEGRALSVFGIPCATGIYASTALPILLSVWAMSRVEQLMQRTIPEVFSTVMAPFATMIVMTPLSLCVLSPLGNLLGSWIGKALVALGSLGGIITVLGGGIVAALWLPLVVTGMHTSIIGLGMSAFIEAGIDRFAMVAIALSVWSTYGTELGTALRLRDANERSFAWSCLFTNMVGGVAEPFIFGVLFKYPRLWATRAIGAFACGSLAMALGVGYYNMHTTSVLNLLAFVGNDSQNIVNACICAAFGFVVSLVATYTAGFTSEELEGEAV